MKEPRPTQVGLIVLQADETLERDMRALLPPQIEYLVSRVPSGAKVTPETLAKMESALAQSAALFPAGAHMQAVAYGCTSGTAQIGAARVTEQVRVGVNTPAVTDPVTALIAACKALDVTRIGLLSPYVASVSDRLRMVLADAGVAVTVFDSFNEPVEEKVVRIAAKDIIARAIKLGQKPDCEAVFVSCTNLRTLDTIGAIESACAKPALSSNQVLAWHLGQLAGFNIPSDRPGRLFG